MSESLVQQRDRLAKMILSEKLEHRQRMQELHDLGVRITWSVELREHLRMRNAVEPLQKQLDTVAAALTQTRTIGFQTAKAES